MGVGGSSATGKVYNLKTLADFDDYYVGAGTGMTVAGGRSRAEIKNPERRAAVLSFRIERC